MTAPLSPGAQHGQQSGPSITLGHAKAGIEDLIAFFKALPNPDKQFAVLPGISHASFQQKNYLTVYHILHGFFSQPPPVYPG